MCVIIASKNKNQRPSLDSLRRAEQANPHGGGIAWVDRDIKRVRYQKGITADEMFEIAKAKTGPVVYHFRITSIGKTLPELCHPFPVARSGANPLQGRFKAVLFHNGTWMNWNKELPKGALVGELSDSRAAAWLVAQHGRSYIKDHHLTGKYCILDGRGDMTFYGTWHQFAGLWCSNTYWCTSANESVLEDNYEEDGCTYEPPVNGGFASKIARLRIPPPSANWLTSEEQ